MSNWLSGLSAFRSTNAANAQAEGQAYTAQMNADIMNQNAALEARRRDRETMESRIKFNLAQGKTRSQFGLLGGFGGSSLDVLADLQGQAVFEQTSIVDERTGAQKNYLNQASMYKSAARNLLNSRQSPWLNAGLAWTESTVSSLEKIATAGMAGGSSGFSGGASSGGSMGGP